MGPMSAPSFSVASAQTTGNTGKSDDGIDFKYPSWDGDWNKWTDYQLRVELRADSLREDELPFLGPRLASNLVGRAFDAIAEVDRSQLKKANGWSYLLKFLEKTRGRERIDLLGDAFNEFLLKREVYRKPGEELPDFEPRFIGMIRKLEKAMKESGSEGKIPSEVYGWFLLNCYMQMEPSDIANVRGQSDTYRLNDVLTALQKMWSGGGLAAKDAEVKRRKHAGGHAMHVEEIADGETEIYMQMPDASDGQLDDDVESATDAYQEALTAFLDDPDSNDVLASFREARKALGQAKTARGFYPVRNPNFSGRGYGNYSKGQSKGGGRYSGDRSYDHSDKTCVRCGKKGHIARYCPQKQNSDRGSQHGGSVGFVGMIWGCTSIPENAPIDTLSPESESSAIDYDQCGDIWNANGTAATFRGQAVLDSGASDNVIGVETLQDLAELYEELGFSADAEFEINRTVHKSFIYGSDHSNQAIGLAHLNVGILGSECTLDVHVIEGSTPLLLSAKFLYDTDASINFRTDASINFRTGVAVFAKMSSKAVQLSRGPGNHLLLPITAFAGRSHLVRPRDEPNALPAEEVLRSGRVSFSEPDATRGESLDS